METFAQLIDQLPVSCEVIKFCKIQLLSYEEIADFKNNTDWKTELKVNIEYDLAYEKLYIGQWNQVPEEHRRMFQVLSFLKAFAIVRKQNHLEKEEMLKALNVLDLAIIIGSGLEEARMLTIFAQKLHELMGEHSTQRLV